MTASERYTAAARRLRTLEVGTPEFVRCGEELRIAYVEYREEESHPVAVGCSRLAESLACSNDPYYDERDA